MRRENGKGPGARSAREPQDNSNKLSHADSDEGEQRTLAEVDKFWRDRSGRAIVTRLTAFKTHSLVDIRTWFTADDGTMRPAKGLTCSVRLLPELAKAIAKATTKAHELGLIAGDGGADD